MGLAALEARGLVYAALARLRRQPTKPRAPRAEMSNGKVAGIGVVAATSPSTTLSHWTPWEPVCPGAQITDMSAGRLNENVCNPTLPSMLRFASWSRHRRS